MRTYDYINAEHKIIIDNFLTHIIEAADSCSPTNTRFSEFMYVVDMILDYHNEYGKGTSQANYLDYLNIIPTNGLCAINGFLAGLTTRNNTSKIALYKKNLSVIGVQTIEKLAKIKTIYD